MQDFENFALSPKARSATIDAVKADNKADKQWRGLADVYHADGIRAEYLETGKKGGSDKLRNIIKDTIFEGLSDAEKRIIQADVKTLTDVQKTARNDAKDKIEKYLVKIRNYLKEDETKAAKQAALDAGLPVPQESGKTDLQKIHEYMDKVIKTLEGMESATFNIVQAVKDAKSLKGSMPSI